MCIGRERARGCCCRLKDRRGFITVMGVCPRVVGGVGVGFR